MVGLTMTGRAVGRMRVRETVEITIGVRSMYDNNIYEAECRYYDY